MPLTDSSTESLEHRIRRPKLPWQEIAEIVTELHRRYQAQGVSDNYRQTGLRLGMHGSLVAKYHKLWDYRHLDEVWQAPAVSKALRLLQAHLAPKQSSQTKEWLGRAKPVWSPETEIKRKLCKIFKEGTH